MNDPAKRPAEYWDLFDLPSKHVIGEILHGQFITNPAPRQGMHAPPRSSAADSLHPTISTAPGGPGGRRSFS